MPTISTTVDVDFDLSDYESEIKSEYCNGNCLKEYDLLKDKLKECALLFVVGIIFLIIAFAVFPMINGSSGLLDVIGESISIIGWVFLWDLTEILCFTVTKLHKKKRYLDRLIESRVEFDTY